MLEKNEHWIMPTWPAPRQVKALSTLRVGGASDKPFDSFNLGDHVDDNPAAVLKNRQLLQDLAHLPEEPRWISQVHGKEVLDLDDYKRSATSKTHNAHTVLTSPTTPPIHAIPTAPIADASISFKPHQVSVVLTADCLPVLLCDRKGSRIAAIHAGWRGLAQGIIQETVAKLNCNPADLLAWMGPAIGPEAFEVGNDVKEAFCMEEDSKAFKPHLSLNGITSKWKADLYTLARIRLQHFGITEIYGGEFCTFTEKDKFFSFRRENPTGRQATLIWLEE